MTSATTPLPPLTRIAAALRKTTEVLARELAVPTGRSPDWTEFEWNIARAVSAMHGVSALLHQNLRWESPDAWWRFLREQRDQSVARYLRIMDLLDAIDSQARRAGLPFDALKGSALQAIGIYRAGERPMGDIDLLVRQHDADGIGRVLEACGYEAAFTTQRHRVYQPRDRKALTRCSLGEHVGNPIKIEIHTRIAEQLPVLPTDITRFLFPSVMHPGLNGYPSSASLMMHLLLHAAGNMRARALRLIQLQDIAWLAGRFRPDDWQELLTLRSDRRSLWWASAPLMLAGRYYPASIPSNIYPRLATECPWLHVALARQRRLTEVSWSNIRIEAFPGVEWSRNPLEALEFMASRIWPTRRARLEVKHGGEQIPGSAAVPWYGLSHGARILRWVLSRPPRVQTMLSVHAALAPECQS